MPWMSLLFGALVGLSLGLTGGGGALFGVPLLVYGLGVAPREAVGISLAAVGATSLVGFLNRLRQRQVEIRAGLIFAVAGMLGAPVGSLIGGRLPEPLLLSLFAGLMLVVAVRMWYQAGRSSPPAVRMPAEPATALSAGDTSAAGCQLTITLGDREACERDGEGALILTSRCSMLLLILGVFTGILAGLFGVGGGIIIVPSLMFFTGMSMPRAVGTSLLVMAMISLSGVASHLWAGREISLQITLLFVAGGISGLLTGEWIGRHLTVAMLQRIFSVIIVLVAGFIIFRSLTF